jgi:hypothetical protein
VLAVAVLVVVAAALVVPALHNFGTELGSGLAEGFRDSVPIAEPVGAGD